MRCLHSLVSIVLGWAALSQTPAALVVPALSACHSGLNTQPKDSAIRTDGTVEGGRGNGGNEGSDMMAGAGGAGGSGGLDLNDGTGGGGSDGASADGGVIEIDGAADLADDPLACLAGLTFQSECDLACKVGEVCWDWHRRDPACSGTLCSIPCCTDLQCSEFASKRGMPYPAAATCASDHLCYLFGATGESWCI
jgi:hypothetical protein